MIPPFASLLSCLLSLAGTLPALQGQVHLATTFGISPGHH